MWAIYDHVNGNGENAIAQWTRGLEKTQRTKLRSKLDMLAQFGSGLPPQLLAGTGTPHIYKLKVKGNVQLRPMLCKGTVEPETEFTLLLGAIEVGDELQPGAAVNMAAAIRLEVIADPNNRRCEHERIN